MNDFAKLRTAAEAVIRAADAYHDALNGEGHPDEPHDRMLHAVLSADFDVFDTVGDCAACGGAQYGTEDALTVAYGDLRAALGQKRKPWEFE